MSDVTLDAFFAFFASASSCFTLLIFSSIFSSAALCDAGVARWWLHSSATFLLAML